MKKVFLGVLALITVCLFNTSAAGAANGYRLFSTIGEEYDFGGSSYLGSTGGFSDGPNPVLIDGDTWNSKNGVVWLKTDRMPDPGVLRRSVKVYGQRPSLITDSYLSTCHHNMAFNILDPVAMSLSNNDTTIWVLERNGRVHDCAGSNVYGSFGGAFDGVPVGIESTASGTGYWVVTSNGAVYSFGDAAYYGGANTINLQSEIVDVKSSLTGKGYWLVAKDGGVFTYGDAKFYRSAGNINLDYEIVDMKPTVDNKGYWLLGNDGGVFTYGNARFFGSMTGVERGIESPIAVIRYMLITN